MSIALIVHGGAWDIPDGEVDEHKDGCRQALGAGWAVLEAGGSALDAAEAAVRVLEDAPIFDAGVGSVLNRDGDVELDAAMMDGATLSSGAVAAVRRVRNPITLARRVLESHVVLLVAQGAERFAQQAGIPLCDPAELIVERERRLWAAQLEQERAQAQAAPPPGPTGTVGAVALDSAGHLAAATSTGGMSHKLPGRVGDSPLVGCGLYADDLTAGCSSTGWGEAIIRVLLAKTATDLIGAGHEPFEAARMAIDVLARRVSGYGGCILLDARGRVGLAFNTPRMAYAYRTSAGAEAVGV